MDIDGIDEDLSLLDFEPDEPQAASTADRAIAVTAIGIVFMPSGTKCRPGRFTANRLGGRRLGDSVGLCGRAVVRPAGGVVA
jgi:hypothetical protein